MLNSELAAETTTTTTTKCYSCGPFKATVRVWEWGYLDHADILWMKLSAWFDGEEGGEGGRPLFTFIGQLISSSSSRDAGTTFGIYSSHSLTHGKDGNPSSSPGTSKVKTCHSDFFCSKMIHNAASPKAGNLAHALSTLAAKTKRRRPAVLAAESSFLIFYTETAWDGHRQLFCVCTFGFVHVCSCGTWGPVSRLPWKLRVLAAAV